MLLSPHVAEHFPDDRSVNSTLRKLISRGEDQENVLISSVRSMPSLYFSYPCADFASVMVYAVIKNVLQIAMLTWVKATLAPLIRTQSYQL